MAKIPKIDGESVQERIRREGCQIRLSRGEVVALAVCYPIHALSVRANPRKYVGKYFDQAVERGRKGSPSRGSQLHPDEHRTLSAQEAVEWIECTFGLRVTDLPCISTHGTLRSVMDVNRSRFVVSAQSQTYPATVELCHRHIKALYEQLYAAQAECKRLESLIEKRGLQAERAELGHYLKQRKQP